MPTERFQAVETTEGLEAHRRAGQGKQILLAEGLRFEFPDGARSQGIMPGLRETDGPLRLSYLESLLRVADWRGSELGDSRKA